MKKVLSAVLALVMAAGMATTAFAADMSAMTASDIAKTSNLKLMVGEDSGDKFYEKEYKFTEKFYVGDGETINFKNGVYGTPDTYIYLMAKVASGDTAGAGLVVASNSDLPGNDTWAFIKETQVKRWDLSVKMTKTSTNIKSPGIKYVTDDKLAVVKVEFLDSLAATGAKTANDTLVIYSGDKKMRSSDLKIETKLENRNTNKIEDEDVEEIYADSENARMIEVKKYQPKVKVYTEYDGIISTRMYEKKYYIELSEKPDSTAIAVMDKYGFEMYRKLTQIGLSDSSTITFDIDDTFFVYGIAADANYDAVADSVQLVYLGKSNAQLPITTDYFFSVKELTIETAPTDEPPVESSTDPSESTNPPTGPVETAPNGNFNPGTGR